jgi:hypothetical protein
LAFSLRDLLARVPLSRKPEVGGETRTATFQPYAPNYQLVLPTYLEHMVDIAQERASTDSKQLIKDLLKNDPDMSAALHAYLTLGDTEMIAYAVDLDGNIDPDATCKVHRLITRITRETDYTKGYTLKEDLAQTNANMRYMVLMRGGVATELVLDKGAAPSLRLIDNASLRWFEPKPGLYKPGQLVMGDPLPHLLDYPTFRVSFYRRDPTTIYTYSDFVSAINTVVARQAVINDLYRIMRLTGYPRMDIEIVESVIIDNAPLDIKSDQQKLRDYVRQQMAALSGMFDGIRVDQALTHPDTVKVKILNDKAAGIAVDINPVIDTLNAQNQAALKTMATVIGRGQAGVNTGSVEARMAAMYADQLNRPLAEMWAGHLSYAMHQEGYQGYVNVRFRAAELRPITELEPQLVLKAQRLRQDLSDGIITDIEYTMEMYGRLPHADAPELSGTGFMDASNIAGGDNNANGAVDPADVSPNADPLGRSISPKKTAMTKANRPKSKTVKPAKNQ